MPASAEHKEIKKLLKSISNKRARIVIEHILQNGFVTTEQLEKQYGYNHPPRAARDVRETGIPLETFRIKDSPGRTIAAYRFGDLKLIRMGRLAGRQIFNKKFRDALYAQSDGKCSICGGIFEQRYLQIDHRVPYEVAEDAHRDLNPENFMLVCGSCNRAKSWSCEHCINWQSGKSPQVCLTCYWGNPENHVHVALKGVRRTDILWNQNEVQLYENLKESADQNEFAIPEYVIKVIAIHLGKQEGG
ncbi:MAG TPA: HNH endonuclease signature motif containing protein [Anaerolineales bacterium]|nr:HNH endonuclease signature motif containing protein [Anaerolineales bacterium]